MSWYALITIYQPIIYCTSPSDPLLCFVFIKPTPSLPHCLKRRLFSVPLDNFSSASSVMAIPRLPLLTFFLTSLFLSHILGTFFLSLSNIVKITTTLFLISIQNQTKITNKLRNSTALLKEPTFFYFIFGMNIA